MRAHLDYIQSRGEARTHERTETLCCRKISNFKFGAFPGSEDQIHFGLALFRSAGSFGSALLPVESTYNQDIIFGSKWSRKREVARNAYFFVLNSCEAYIHFKF